MHTIVVYIYRVHKEGVIAFPGYNAHLVGKFRLKTWCCLLVVVAGEIFSVRLF